MFLLFSMIACVTEEQFQEQYLDLICEAERTCEGDDPCLDAEFRSSVLGDFRQYCASDEFDRSLASDCMTELEVNAETCGAEAPSCAALDELWCSGQGVIDY